MRKNLLHKWLLLFCFAAPAICCRAQSSYKYEVPITAVKSSGFYKIVLPPAVVSKSNNDVTDIRILDDKNKQVPYLLKSEQSQFQEKNLIEMQILAVRKEADKQTHIVIQNQSHKVISELLLVIKNTDAERTVTISGSDDQKQWFVIKEHIPLNNLFVQDQDRFIQSLSFPNSSYSFFEIVINGKDVLPVNIVKVGVYEDLNRMGNYVQVPDPVISQHDSSNKISYVRVEFNDSYRIDKLQLELRGPKFYRRQAIIREGDKMPGTAIDNFIISSAIPRSYVVNVKARKLLLEIDNQDSPPLEIRSAQAFQLNKYLLTYLEPDVKYTLIFGDPSAGAPRYDLEFFKDSIHNTAAEIGIGSIIKIADDHAVSNNKGGNGMLILWIIIVAVLVLLLILTFRMIREMKARKDNLDN